MILLVSHAGDGHLPLVVERLRLGGHDPVLLDTDLYPAKIGVTDGPSGCTLAMGELSLALSDVSAVWWRRPRPPIIGDRSPEVVDWAQRQAFAALDSALMNIDAVWVNHPRANRIAEDKPANLRRADACGLRVPDWCVTNEPDRARAFMRSVDAVVAKPVESAWVSEGASFWTRQVDDATWLDRIGPEPYMLQQFIDKSEDVRVIVIGDEVFAVAIESQITPATSVDFRAGRVNDLPHRITTLPAAISDAVRDLTRSLSLRFAAIDLVADAEGQYWFLELNPNGQWAWLEHRTQVPISQALVAALT